MKNKKLNDALKEKTKIQIITFLMRGDASFSGIMTHLDERDSGRVNYHVKSLLELGLIAKIEEKYTLTRDGERFGLYAKQFELKEQYPIPVACCKVRRADGKILMAKRAKKPFINYWVFPGGKINHGETVFATAKRETMEECGVEILPKKIVGVYPTLFNDEAKTTHHIFLTLVEADLVREHEHLISDESDVKEFAWFSEEEMKQLRIVASNKIFLESNKNHQGQIKEQVIES